MTAQPDNGTRQNFDGKECIFYDGYWIRYYEAPEDSLSARKQLIDHLTRRTFRHTEPGINTPGYRLEEARAAYEREQDPARKRVNAAMLAGALFNRATDIFTAIVELEAKGITVNRDNELMKQCSNCFHEALELGRQVKHHSGHEGIDELWGEPLKAFTQPVARLFEARYRKIAQAMRDIDRISERLAQVFAEEPAFDGVATLAMELAASAKLQTETMKSDPVFFQVWPAFVSARERLDGFVPALDSEPSAEQWQRIEEGVNLIKAGAALVTYLSEARVPMPKSTRSFLAQCDAFQRR
ncbi:MAG TPA: hypothetical protein ENI96_04550 [Sedimenticola thiotaurini]|uniref:Uncharacterized protein n=1 Tax=Sedimenticola thiotaurini TaxID=1543721 RepID=A0A831RMI7_9GAMM|nr:hypothetical protein [Sedimenticola thiotaurini]